MKIIPPNLISMDSIHKELAKDITEYAKAMGPDQYAIFGQTDSQFTPKPDTALIGRGYFDTTAGMGLFRIKSTFERPNFRGLNDDEYDHLADMLSLNDLFVIRAHIGGGINNQFIIGVGVYTGNDTWLFDSPSRATGILTTSNSFNPCSSYWKGIESMRVVRAVPTKERIASRWISHDELRGYVYWRYLMHHERKKAHVEIP